MITQVYFNGIRVGYLPNGKKFSFWMKVRIFFDSRWSYTEAEEAWVEELL